MLAFRNILLNVGVAIGFDVDNNGEKCGSMRGLWADDVREKTETMYMPEPRTAAGTVRTTAAGSECV